MRDVIRPGDRTGGSSRLGNNRPRAVHGNQVGAVRPDLAQLRRRRRGRGKDGAGHAAARGVRRGRRPRVPGRVLDKVGRSVRPRDAREDRHATVLVASGRVRTLKFRPDPTQPNRRAPSRQWHQRGVPFAELQRRGSRDARVTGKPVTKAPDAPRW
jgi:hypothetical protein